MNFNNRICSDLTVFTFFPVSVVLPVGGQVGCGFGKSDDFSVMVNFCVGKNKSV